MIYFIPFTFKIFILRKFLIIFLLFSCKEKPNLEDKLEQIKKTENFNIMEWTTRNVFEITFTNNSELKIDLLLKQIKSRFV
jgi:hypothetical protein